MSERGPWSVKGIDQRARAAARQAAQNEGLTLGEYLNRLLLEEAQAARSETRAAPAATPDMSDLPAAASDDGADTALGRLARRVEEAEARSTAAISGLEQAIAQVIDRLDRGEHARSGLQSDMNRMAGELREAHDALRQKVTELERTPTSGAASGTAPVRASSLRALEAAVGQLTRAVDARLDGLRSAADQANRTAERTAERLSNLQEDIAPRLTRTETTARHAASESAQQGERLDMIDDALSHVQDRLSRAETTTNAALERMEQRLGDLDSRIDGLAGGAPDSAGMRDAFDARFAALAKEVRQQVDQARADMAREIEDAARGAPAGLARYVEQALSAVQARLERSDRRQDERLEALRDALHAIESKTGSQDIAALEQDIARLSDTVEGRLAEVEAREASTVERLGRDLGDLAETLTQRVNESEERSASAIEEVGEQVASATQRLQARQEEAIEQMNTRLSEAQARQEARLSDALSNVSTRLDAIHRQTGETLSPVQKAISSLAARLETLELQTGLRHRDDEDGGQDPDGSTTPSGSGQGPRFGAHGPGLDAAGGDPAVEVAAPADDTFEPGLPGWPDRPGPPGPDAVDPLAAYAETDPEPASSAGHFDTPFDPDFADDPMDDGGSEVRDSDIFDPEDAAERAAALTGGGEDAGSGVDGVDGPDAAEGTSSAPGAEPESGPPLRDGSPAGEALIEHTEANAYLNRARKAALAAQAGSNRTAEGIPRPPRRGPPRLPLLATASAVVVVAAGTAGYLHLRGKQPVGEDIVRRETTTPPTASADATASPSAPTLAALVRPRGDASAPERPDRAPTDLRRSGTAAPASENAADLAPIPDLLSVEAAAADGVAEAQLILAVEALNAERFSDGATLMLEAAEAGHATGAYELAKLYEQGLGLPRDLEAARAWTERAAEGGNIRAMHDLAVYFAEGEGGPRSYAKAAEWFRKAADHGVVDSQFNLATLYEHGAGLSANRMEAVFWYRLAEQLGDAAAPAKADALDDDLSSVALADIAKRLSTWTASKADPAANTLPVRAAWTGLTPMHVARLEAALAALGHDPGPVDQTFDDATRDAVAAYRRKTGLGEGGGIDADLVQSINAQLETRRPD